MLVFLREVNEKVNEDMVPLKRKEENSTKRNENQQNQTHENRQKEENANWQNENSTYAETEKCEVSARYCQTIPKYRSRSDYGVLRAGAEGALLPFTQRCPCGGNRMSLRIIENANCEAEGDNLIAAQREVLPHSDRSRQSQETTPRPERPPPVFVDPVTENCVGYVAGYLVCKKL